jgi:TonB family protein
LKNIQVFDGADNAVDDIFAETDEELPSSSRTTRLDSETTRMIQRRVRVALIGLVSCIEIGLAACAGTFVRVAVLVGADGGFLKGEVRKSSGSRELDQATIAAASGWCWKPSTENGMAVEKWQEFSYTWQLD